MSQPDRDLLHCFLPMTRAEMVARGWDALDILLITGDAYVDHPSFAAALLGRFLEARGYRVGIIAQPNWRNPESLAVLGAPRLFVGICAGALDSMLNLYTANKKRRTRDAYSPGGRNDLRPRRATIVYTNLARRVFPDTPIVIGGIEASLRRFAHYDYWDDRVRSSILLDSGADLLVYGMGERAILAIARRLSQTKTARALRYIPGTVFVGTERDLPQPARCVWLPSREEIEKDAVKLLEATRLALLHVNPYSRRYLVQADEDRLVIATPPQPPLTTSEFDSLYELPFQRREHWSYREPVPALEPVRWSLTVQRGCYGGCTYCTLGVHQGKVIQSRSIGSILREIESLAAMAAFRGTISDLGGPTANMYGTGGANPEVCRRCRRPSCLFPRICRILRTDARPLLKMLRAVRESPSVRHAFIASGVRYDLALLQGDYLRTLVTHHTGGHLSVAPEHVVEHVLCLMARPPHSVFEKFRAAFHRYASEAGKELYLVPYFISSFPGCTEADMRQLRAYIRRTRLVTHQVQDFIPLPMTMAAAMFYAGRTPEGRPIYVARTIAEKRRQQAYLRAPARVFRGSRPVGRPPDDWG